MYICVFVYLLICVFVRLHTCVFVFLCLFVSYIQKAGILGILPIILTNIRNLANRKTTLLWDNLVWYLIVILAKHPTPFPGMFSSWYIIIPQLCFHKFFAFENDLRITLEHKFHSCNSSFGFGSWSKRSFVIWFGHGQFVLWIVSSCFISSFSIWNKDISDYFAVHVVGQNICFGNCTPCANLGLLFVTLIQARHDRQMSCAFETQWLQITQLLVYFLVCIDLKRVV